MKMKMNMLLLALVTLLLSGCTSAFYASSGASDDLYAIHNRTEIARRQQAEAEARKAEWEAKIAEAAAVSSQQNYLSGSRTENFQSVLADDYESAYARRLRGMESPTYRMPSSYMNARYSSTFNYVSAYDPAFYNVMVMGDEVWVEPKYVTAMFGTWGLPSYSSAWYWNRWTTPWWMPSYSFSIGGWGWNIGLSWYDPWFYDWYNPWYGPYYRPYYGWYSPYNPYYYHHHHHHHGPYWNGGGGHHPGRPGVVHRPSANHYTKPYGGQGSTVNRTQHGDRNWNSGVYQGGSRPQNGRPQGSGTVSRTPEGSQKPSYNNSGSSSRRSSSSGSNSSNYRPDNNRSNSGWSNNSSSNSNWGSSNSSSRGGGYSSGGGFSGGGSRSGSSGSSSRGR